MILKYIVVRDNHGNPREDGPERAILFDKELVHKHVARVHRVGELVVVSAGFVDINGYNVRVYGKSESLGISSRPDDFRVVNDALLGGGYRGFDNLWINIDVLDKLMKDCGKSEIDIGTLKSVLMPVRDFLSSLLPPYEPVTQDQEPPAAL